MQNIQIAAKRAKKSRYNLSLLRHKLIVAYYIHREVRSQSHY